MARKTYRTYFLKGLQILTNDENGSRYEVVFRGGSQIDSTARFTTSEKWLQDVMEDPANGFNRDYYLESVRDSESAPVEKAPAPAKKKEEPEEKPLTDVKDIKRFHNLVEMRNHMAELGFKDVQSMNYLQAKAAAAKEGYDFQISKA